LLLAEEVLILEVGEPGGYSQGMQASLMALLILSPLVRVVQVALTQLQMVVIQFLTQQFLLEPQDVLLPLVEEWVVQVLMALLQMFQVVHIRADLEEALIKLLSPEVVYQVKEIEAAMRELQEQHLQQVLAAAQEQQV
jgi:hypothetical protein